MIKPNAYGLPSFAAILMLSTGCGDNGRLVEVIEKDFSARNVENLVIDNDSGDLLIQGSSSSSDVIEVTVMLRSDDFSNDHRDDEDAINDLLIDLQCGTSSQARLLAEIDDSDHRYSIDVDIRIPDRLTLDIRDDSGDVSIDGAAGLIIDDNSGDLTIEQITGKVEIDDDSGDIELINVEGEVRVVDDSGDLTIKDVVGDVDIRDDSGDIYVSDVDGTVTIRDGSGDIEVRNADDVDVISDDSGELDIR